MTGGGSIDIGSIICISGFILAIVFFVVVVVVSVRKVPCGVLPPMDMQQLFYNIDVQSRMRGWQATVTPHEGRVAITKDSIVATNMFFVQRHDGRIAMFYSPAGGAIGWVLVIILMGTIFGSLLVGWYLHMASGKFAREEVVPMIIPAPEPVFEVQSI